MLGAMLDLSRIRAISLDLDDTLWPVLPTLKAAEAAQHAFCWRMPRQRPRCCKTRPMPSAFASRCAMILCTWPMT